MAATSNGKVTLTLNPNEFLDPAILQSDLAKYGIPAKVTSGSFCSSDPAPAGFSQVVSLPPREAPVPPQSGVPPTITFDPAAMPAGTELSFGFFQLTSGLQQVPFALIDATPTRASAPARPSRPTRRLAAGIRRRSPGPAGALIDNVPTVRSRPGRRPRPGAGQPVARDPGCRSTYCRDDQRGTRGGQVLRTLRKGLNAAAGISPLHAVR